MSSEAIDLPHLRTLIGLRLRHQGQVCRVIEVLDEPPALVLEPEEAPRIMPDHHGRAFEYDSATHVVPVLSDDRLALNDAWLELELLD